MGLGLRFGFYLWLGLGLWLGFRCHGHGHRGRGRGGDRWCGGRRRRLVGACQRMLGRGLCAGTSLPYLPVNMDSHVPGRDEMTAANDAPQVCEEGPGQDNDLGGIPIFRGIDLPEAYRHQYRDTNNTSFYGMRQARNISIFLHIVIRAYYSPQQHQRGRQLSHHHGHDRHRHQDLSYECILLIVCPYIHTIEDQPQPLPEEHTATTTPLPRY